MYVGQLRGHRWELILNATVNESTWTDAGSGTTTTVSKTPFKRNMLSSSMSENKKGWEEL